MTSLLPPTWHPALYAVLGAVAVGYLVATARRYAATRPQRWRFAWAVVLLLVAYGWPLGDLARHVSLTSLVLQRLVVMLGVAPLLLTCVPHDLAAAVSRPRGVDRALVLLAHPAAAVVTVTVLGTATLTPAAVGWGSGSGLATSVLALVTVGLGIVLWLPVLSNAPAHRRLSNVAQGGYLLVASLVVTSLSLVWIFAKRPLYPSLHHTHTILALSPILDQQLAGYVAKFGAYGPMWALAFVLFARSTERDDDDAPLRWVDVQRELERVDRVERRERHEPHDATP
ncbi:MAG TPA: cytochrome c oxidase assembly protein [Acidimicrobiales bacterium]|nr:cytochrome c oxidase assembly protein [Acidimicrobiales bacterium]